jgi:hypothetical protein
MYLNNLKEQNIKYSFINIDDGDYSAIRKLPSVEMMSSLLNPVQPELFNEVSNV